MNYRNLIKILLLVLVPIFISGCTDKKEPCDADEVVKNVLTLVSKNEQQTKPCQADIDVSYMKSLFVVNGRGHVLFVPPDTILIEVTAEWGETLLKMRGAGNSISYEAPIMKMGGAYTFANGIGLLGGLIFGGYTIPEMLLDNMVLESCDGSKAVLGNASYNITYDISSRSLLGIAGREPGWNFEIIERSSAENGNLPVLVSVKTKKSGSLKMRILSRKIRNDLSGEHLLK